MRIPEFLNNAVDAENSAEFDRRLRQENFRRGKILAIVVIVFEALYAAAVIVSSTLKVDSRFHFGGYLTMYLIMIGVNAVFLLFIHYYEKNAASPDFGKVLLKTVLIVYITFMMTWGSVVTLMDQQLYGQIVAYSINTIICSVVFMLKLRSTLIPFGVSVLVLAVGLPFFQPSGDILTGHYVNLAVFIVISWLASRILFNSYCRSFTSSILLSRANQQLKALTLQDELTGIPNRRSFRDFIDRTFESSLNELSTLSVIMIDIDFFKQFNDCYGHEEGDMALRAIAGEISAIVKEPFEFAVRWGGEEFVYGAFNVSPAVITDRARAIVGKVSALGIVHRLSPVCGCITVSLGVSTIGVSSRKDVKRAVVLADEALYQAKSSGRNCIKFLDDDSALRNTLGSQA